MSEESTVVETEQGQAPVIDTPETHEIDPVESKAREMGWRPKEEYDGDPETWVDAKEYVGRKPLYDEIHKTRKQVKNLERTQNAMAQYVKKVEEVAYKKAMADLKAQRKEAISEADPDKVEEIDREIEDLNKSRQNVAAEPPPEFREWLDENAWYNPEKNPDVCAEADAFAMAYRQRNPNATFSDVLDHVAAKVKKANPELFQAASEKPKPKAAAVEGGRQPASTKPRFTRAHLSEEQRRVCDTFVRQGVMTQDEYIKSLADMGELK
jgi:hypothetical protein